MHAIERGSHLCGVVTWWQIEEAKHRDVARRIRPFIIRMQAILILEQTAITIRECGEVNLQLIVTRRNLRGGTQIHARSVHCQTG